MDYCFQGNSQDEEEEEESGTQSNQTILILHDDFVDGIWALQVEAKGVREEVVDWVLQKIEEAGHMGTDIT